MTEIRAYRPTDESSWLRCRALSFLDTCYYDDVFPVRPTDPDLQLVAADGTRVTGILDVSVDGSLTTIDTVAVHPDHRSSGIATRLLAETLAQLPGTVDVLDAWTREDQPALDWYRTRGFDESEHYLHVYTSSDEPAPEELRAAPPFHGPQIGFYHVAMEHEQTMRARFERVYVCRRMSRSRAPSRSDG